MKDAVYSTKHISQDQKLRIPNKSLIGGSILTLAMAQPRSRVGGGRNHSAGIFVLEIMKDEIIFCASF